MFLHIRIIMGQTFHFVATLKLNHWDDKFDSHSSIVKQEILIKLIMDLHDPLVYRFRSLYSWL